MTSSRISIIEQSKQKTQEASREAKKFLETAKDKNANFGQSALGKSSGSKARDTLSFNSENSSSQASEEMKQTNHFGRSAFGCFRNTVAHTQLKTTINLFEYTNLSKHSCFKCFIFYKIFTYRNHNKKGVLL